MAEIRFDGKVAVVTGAGAGLGREYALLLGSRGAKVVVNDLGGHFDGEGQSTKAADVVVEEIKALGGIAVPNYNSVTDGDKIIETAINNFGRVDIVINNAGILRDKSFANISEKDWDLIQDVHVKGSFKTTQAAWPYFKKQKYGRIILTASNSGIYGNFGQANYSSAKLGLVGLANTLAIEGGKYKIHCNVIVPTAASRLTEGILPDIMFQQLKPKLIAPVVAYLCHESCQDNGSIIESAAGWATKIHFVRGKGAVLRKSLDENDIKPEVVRDKWQRITDMSKAKRFNAIQEASGNLLEIIEGLQDGTQGDSEFEDTFKFGSKDLILYSLGIGASVTHKPDMRYLYENHEDFGPFPTYFVLPGLLLSMGSTLVASALKHTQVDFTNILHGEQYLEILSDLPKNGELTTKGEVFDIMDKKSGAAVVTNCNSYDQSGNLIVKNQSTTFVVGAGNFGGKKDPKSGVVPILKNPNRKPDKSVIYKTSLDQAALYRLSGDLNPLHIDPNMAVMAGFKVPILHGLCSLGFSVRAVLNTYAGNDASQFKAVKVRFSNPVLPGQSLRVDMWCNKNEKRIYFRTVVIENNKEVISGAYVDLKNIVAAKL
ncbi:peroxisomal multifunctional enzyme type 2 [Condylostylus longicornis]|uniref:peroxisomal multifunctional enzyme type 2 n=1 Tax=Condylostylus longicornis TaxID=2530218 RepID=UPI00244D9F97|nr:peroxisomal multifunctional enzyme type 2 [Condylostylus longicornis]